MVRRASRRSVASPRDRVSDAQRALLLSIARTDSTFERMELRGQPVWVGRCIHCSSRLVLLEDGRPAGDATVEHLVPQHAGGTDDPLNLALSCRRCNNQKGVHHDGSFGRDPAVNALVDRLLKKRRARWRDPERA